MAEVIGLTGQTGAGKSTVRKLLKAKGAAVIDADFVAHEVADNNLSCLTDIVEHFSCMVLDEKGKLNRRALGRIVFSDRKKPKGMIPPTTCPITVAAAAPTNPHLKR